MRIFTINMFLPDNPNPIRLVYQSEERAKNALVQPIGMDGLFSLNDDFGVELRLKGVEPVARILCDVVEELNGNIEIGLLQARAQLKAQQKMKADPTLNGQLVPGSGPVLQFPGPRQ